MKKILLSVAAMAATVTLAQAGGDIVPVYEPVVAPEAIQYDSVPVYLGLGLTRGIYNGSICTGDCPYEDVTGGVTLRAGYDFNEYVGIEARYIGTFWGDDDLGGQKLSHVGLYVKPMMPINEQINIYGLVGYGMTTTTTNSKHLEEVDENGFAAGIGMEYDIDTQDAEGSLESGFGLFVDYQRLLIKSDVPDMDALSAGVTYDF